MAHNKNNNNDAGDKQIRNGGGPRFSRAAKILAVAAGAAGAAAAGYYFYASKNAPKNRKMVAKWAIDFKDDVMRQAQELEHLDHQAIVGIVDGVARAYGKMRNMNAIDLREAADELKANWQRLSAELRKRDVREGRLASRSSSGSARPTKRVSRNRSSQRSSRIQASTDRKTDES